jgi:hypothetical protein
METHVAQVRDFGEIRLKKNDKTPRMVIETLLCDPKCFRNIKPFFVDGGVCGHKVMDLKGAVDILRGFDTERRLDGFDLTDFQVGNVLKNALRTRYELDKRWKIASENLLRVIVPEE